MRNGRRFIDQHFATANRRRFCQICVALVVLMCMKLYGTDSWFRVIVARGVITMAVTEPRDRDFGTGPGFLKRYPEVISELGFYNGSRLTVMNGADGPSLDPSSRVCLSPLHAILSCNKSCRYTCRSCGHAPDSHEKAKCA